MKKIIRFNFIKSYFYNLFIVKSLSLKFFLGFRTIVKIHKTAKVNIKKKFTLGIFYTLKQKNIINLGKNSELFADDVNIGNGSRISLANNAILCLGKDVYFNENCRVMVSEKISIGNNVIIGWDTTILDSDRHQLIVKSEKQKKTKPIFISDDVWIGFGVSIMKGVTIGKGAVVAANSVVTKDIPENCLVAGNPAKVIKENVKWER
ncbi:acyltransferase [Streptococcus pluranimalium]